jgi:putative ABC transport system permease protein
VLRFMALFTVATGLLVLVAAVWSGQFQRVRESTLLRVLGASRKQVMRVLMVEYATLGILAAATGIALAFAAAGGLAFFMFEVAFVPPIWPPLLAAGVVVTLTMATGFVASRGITNHPPLETLRSEG